MDINTILLIIAFIAGSVYHWVVINAADSLEKLGIGDAMKSTNNNGILIQSFIDDCNRLYNVTSVESGSDNCLITVNGVVKIWLRASENSVFGFVDFGTRKKSLNKMSLPSAKITIAGWINDSDEADLFKNESIKKVANENLNLERYKLKRGK